LFVLPLVKIIEASRLTATFGSKRDHQGAILRTRRIVAAVFTAGALLFATATGASAGTSGTVYSAGSYAKATFAPNNPGYHSAYIKVIDNRKDGASAVAQVKFDGTTKNYRASDGVGSSVTWFPVASDGASQSPCAHADRMSRRVARSRTAAHGRRSSAEPTVRGAPVARRPPGDRAAGDVVETRTVRAGSIDREDHDGRSHTAATIAVEVREVAPGKVARPHKTSHLNGVRSALA
jgi:hypothetical protein